MAVETTDIQSIPEISKPISPYSRSYSTGRIEMPNAGQPVPSRYLRKSVGSCHDLCKLGIKNASEAKASHLIFGRVPTIPEECSHSKVKPVKHSPPQGYPGSKGDSKTGGTLPKTRFKISNRQKIRMSIFTRKYGSDGPECQVPAAPSASFTQSVRRVSSGVARIISSSSSKEKCITSKAKTKLPKPEKMSHIISLNAEKKVIGPIKQAKKGGSPSGGITPRLPSSSRENKLWCPRNETSMPISLVSLADYRSGHAESGGCSSQSSPYTSSSRSSSRPSTSSSCRKSSDTPSGLGSKERDYQLARVKGKLKGKPRNTEVPKCGEKFSPPQKLHFRKPKTIEPKSESSIVRILKFRKARVIDESQYSSCDIGRKCYRRTEADAAEIKNNKSEKIVLRHRGMEKRKKDQSLFNNVIEETASKLVRTRKSKVKALVGAFETVISLQDSKQRARIR